MTTRVKGFLVSLEVDIREDDAEVIRQAILAIRHVLAVDPVPASSDDFINRLRVRHELHTKLFEVLRKD